MFATLVDLLPASWQPKAKAFYAGGGSALLSFVLVGALLGTWDKAVLIALLVGAPVAGVTHEVPNRTRRRRAVKKGEEGQASAGLIMFVLVLVLVVLLLKALTGSWLVLLLLLVLLLAFVPAL